MIPQYLELVFRQVVNGSQLTSSRVFSTKYFVLTPQLGHLIKSVFTPDYHYKTLQPKMSFCSIGHWFTKSRSKVSSPRVLALYDLQKEPGSVHMPQLTFYGNTVLIGDQLLLHQEPYIAYRGGVQICTINSTVFHSADKSLYLADILRIIHACIFILFLKSANNFGEIEIINFV